MHLTGRHFTDDGERVFADLSLDLGPSHEVLAGVPLHVEVEELREGHHVGGRFLGLRRPKRLRVLHFEVRSVGQKGEICWRGETLFVSHALQGERIGLEEIDDGRWAVYLGLVLIARLDEQERRLYG